MTPKQTERIKKKITNLKYALAADKRRWGGQYHDGSGLRYLIPEYYIQLQDWKGALKHFKWFGKNFPDDSCYPIFLFEWTVTLFKTGDLKGAERKAFQTFFANMYLFETYSEKKMFPDNKIIGWNWDSTAIGKLPYSKDQPELSEFSNWLDQFLASGRFIKAAAEFREIEKQLMEENIVEKRVLLGKNRREFMNSFTKPMSSDKNKEPAWVNPERGRKTPYTDEEIERFVDGFIEGFPEFWEKLVEDDGPNTARIILRNRFKARDHLRNPPGYFPYLA
jgi:hypothetical protein